MFLVHVFILAISNILVQYPFALFGFDTTWGAFSYPAVFILTDLTARLCSAQKARKIVFQAMVPALIISYGVGAVLATQDFDHPGHLFFDIQIMPLRIAFACFIAYLIGQLFDIAVFQHLRKHGAWWLAPSLSMSLGNILDTFLFFSIAFYHSDHPFLNAHWLDIAKTDMVSKLVIGILAFVPIYGLVLHQFSVHLKNIKMSIPSS